MDTPQQAPAAVSAPLRATAPFRGARRGRAGPRGRGSRSRPSARIAPAPPTITDEVPKPTALSTSSSAMKNDPLLEDHFTAASGPTYVAVIPCPRLKVSFRGFVSTVDAIYDTMVAVDRALRRTISRSLFQYYCAQHLFARVAAARIAAGRNTGREDIFVEAFGDNLYPVPGILDQYLRGIGDFTLTNGSRFDLDLPCFPQNDDGTWLQVDEFTQVLYSAWPAPIIFAHRIIEDLAYTADPVNHNPDWDLPINLRPAPYQPGALADGTIPPPIQPGLPTANLLGWAPATVLLQEQVQVLNSAGITPLHFRREDHRRYWWNSSLMTIVAGTLQGSEYALAPGPHKSINGSIGLQAFAELLPAQDQPDFVRTIEYTQSSQVRSVCFDRIDSRLAVASIMFTYRVPIDPVFPDFNNWACYDWNRYLEVPPPWQQHRNDIFVDGQVNLLNNRWLQTGYYSRSDLLRRSTSSSVKKKGIV